MEHRSIVFKTLDLPGGTLLPISSIRGERVRVVSGRVWLTEEGDLNDEFLASGEEVALGGHGLAVLEALTPARVQLVEPQSLWTAAKNAARLAARGLSELWLTTPRQPKAPIDFTKDMQCPILCLFGIEDTRPSPADAAVTEAALKQHGKTHEIVIYPNAGHAFFAVDRQQYRVQAALDGWKKVFEWFGKYLG